MNLNKDFIALQDVFKIPQANVANELSWSDHRLSTSSQRGFQLHISDEAIPQLEAAGLHHSQELNLCCGDN